MDKQKAIPDDMRAWLLDTRSTLRNPDPWLVDAFTGGRTSVSGERVNPSTVLGISAYYAAIRAISEDVAKLPLPVFERVTERNKERRRKHPTHKLLNMWPNPDMGSMHWRETMMGHALGWGNGYSEIVGTVGTRNVELWPLSPASVKPERIQTGIVDGVPQFTLVYKVKRSPDQAEVTLDQSKVFHLRGLGFDGILGYSVATLGKQSMGLALAEEKSGAAYFGNSARPGGVLETPKVLSKKGRENLKAGWDEAHAGAAKHHSVALLEEGVTWKTISIPNKDAQWLEGRMFSVEEMARWFRISPHKLQHLQRTTFNNIEMLSIEYVTDTLVSWFVRWEQEISRKLIPEQQQTTFFAEHIAEGLLRGDMATQAVSFATARNNGYMSVNEIRAFLNMNDIGPEGDIYLAPLNMVPADKFEDISDPNVPALPAPSSDGDDDDETTADRSRKLLQIQEAERQRLRGIQVRRQSYEPAPVASLPQKLAETNLPLLTAAYERALRIEVDKVERAEKNGGAAKLADTFYAGELKNLQDSLDEAVSAYCGSVWAAMKGTPLTGEVHSMIRLRIGDMVNRHIDKSTTGIAAALELGDCEPMLVEWRGDRATTVARAEIADLAYFMAGMCGQREGAA
ncbi:hypothetical protein LCGC14_1201110 [marine sediment metagenome]|uniref:Phage portal protein n=1 Tax=marine sediment metagenome TaxID=412755 RepID=A0A0F9PLM9_9ZZZZ